MRGPWIAELTDTPYEELGESWVVDGPDGSICAVDCPRDERADTARLIAAAPDLFDALEIIADVLANPVRPGHIAYKSKADLVQIANRALEKVRGEQ